MTRADHEKHSREAIKGFGGTISFCFGGWAAAGLAAVAHYTAAELAIYFGIWFFVSLILVAIRVVYHAKRAIES